MWRREVRAKVDVVTVHETLLSLGAATWPAIEKSPGDTPEGLLLKCARSALSRRRVASCCQRRID